MNLNQKRRCIGKVPNPRKSVSMETIVIFQKLDILEDNNHFSVFSKVMYAGPPTSTLTGVGSDVIWL